MPQENQKRQIYYMILDGKKGKNIFADECDKNELLLLVQQIQVKYGCKVYAYCILENRFHLMAEYQKDNREASMNFLMEEYSAIYNEKRKKQGKVVLRKYRMKKVSNVLETCVLIHLMPVHEGISLTQEDYWWSSYLSYKRYIIKNVIDTHFILSLISNKKRRALKEFDEIHRQELLLHRGSNK